MTVCSTFGANHYVRSGATGTASGNDWTNAYTSLPGSLTRGDTYYIAAGSYGGITINTDVDSTALTIIKKAIGSDHGTGTGWNAAYGTSQAVFNQTVTNNANYIVFDGQTGGGPGSWTTNFGFKIIVNSKTFPAPGLNTAPDFQIEKHHLTFAHFEVEGNHGDTSTSASNDCVVVEKGTHDVTMRYCYLHDAGRCPFIINSQIGNVFTEYAYTGAYSGNHVQHAEIASILPHFSYNFPTQNIVFGNSIFTFIDSTGGLMFNSTSGAVYGCTFYFPNGHQAPNGVVGTWTGAVCRNIKVYNNTFLTPPSGSAINFIGDRQSGNEVYNNLFYNVPSAGVESANAHDYNDFINSGGAHGEAHATTGSANPFINSANADFHLTVNTAPGANLGAPYNVDPDGQTRATWSIGAYEFNGSSGGPTPPPDTTAPTVSIASPANSSTISGAAVNFAATASDNIGVFSVDFLVDGTLRTTATAPPYSYTLDTTALSNGSHTLSVTARDAAANTAQASVTVTVNNAAPAAPVLSASPGMLDFSKVKVNGTPADLNITVTNTGTGTLTASGVTSSAAGLTIASGAGFSLGAGLSGTLAVHWRPTAKEKLSGTITINTNGGSASVHVDGICFPMPTYPANGDAGLVLPPMTAAADHSVSQTIDSQNAIQTSGADYFGVNIATGGDYNIRASVNAPDAASNSFTAAFDAEPTEPTTIADILAPGAGFQTVLLNGRGNGTFDLPQFVPKKFTLSPGVHWFVIRGREPNCKLATVEPIPVAAPTPAPTPPNQAPVAGLSANTTSGIGPLAVTFTLTSSDPDGTVASGVLNYGDGSSPVTITSPGASTTRSHTYASVGSQTTYNATWTITDNLGATNAANTNITVSPVPPPPPNQPPVAGLTVFPTAGVAPCAATLTITSSDPDSGDSVASGVVDYGDGTTPESVTTPAASFTRPHTYSTAGTYNPSWTATDSHGLASTPATASITVANPPPAPVVSLTLPPDQTIYTSAPATVNLAATATSAQGTISKVEFYNGTTKIGEDTSSPYTLTWSGVAAGNYGLKAKAIDNLSVSTFSTPIAIQVLPAGGVILPQGIGIAR